MALLGIEHLTPVGVALCVRQLRERLGRLPLVAVAQRDDVDGPGEQQPRNVCSALTADTDDGDVEHVVCLGPAAGKRAVPHRERTGQPGGA